MNQEKHDALLKSKVDKLINMEMIAQRWYPENVPIKENGEIDFEQFGVLWKEEIPNAVVLENLEDSNIYRTDIDGSIMFKIKNNKLQIETCSP